MIAPPHLQFRSRAGNHLYVANYSRLFDLPEETELNPTDLDTSALIERMGRREAGEDDLSTVPSPQPQSISLNVSSSCNLACSYCYAGQGSFGGLQSARMDWNVAKAAVDRLVDGADVTRPVTVGFLGGEPFVGRDLLHTVVDYAVRLGTARGIDIRFSVTTNGTLLTAADVALLRRYPFAVTVSIDGDAATHDANRPDKRGRGSWHRAIEGILPLLREPGRARTTARATVRRTGMNLTAQFDALAAAGFEEIGFSPLRAGGPDAVTDDDWPIYLSELIRLADAELARAKSGTAMKLSNLAIALKEIHRGAASPYPCGAGGGYFSVAADGDWYACHRAVGDNEFRLGDNSGLDPAKRAAFLAERHVDQQTDCSTCWARYLCSGGCHQEKKTRSRASCDFVRAWLQYCLVTYCEMGVAAKAA